MTVTRRLGLLSVTAQRRQSRAHYPRLELLEERALLSATTVMTVTSSGDSGLGSLSWAVAQAQQNGAGQIEIDIKVSRIYLTTPLVLDISGTVDIKGNGEAILSSGSAFVVQSGSVSISDLTLQGSGHGAGSTGAGVAIVNNGSLSLSDVVLQDFDTALQNNAGASTSASGCNFSYEDTSAVVNSGAFQDLGSFYYSNGSNQESAIVSTGIMALSDDQIIDSDGPYLQGAAVTVNGGSASIQATTISQCVGAPAVYAAGGTLLVSQSTLEDNSNGALYTNCETVVITGSDFNGNTAVTVAPDSTFNTNAIWFSDSTVSITGTSIAGNSQNDTTPYTSVDSTVTLGAGNSFGYNGPGGYILPLVYGPVNPGASSAASSTPASNTTTNTAAETSTPVDSPVVPQNATVQTAPSSQHPFTVNVRRRHRVLPTHHGFHPKGPRHHVELRHRSAILKWRHR